jgi:UDP-N-acetylmuramoyl-L-alanyl-D-glutamate--2,6-diaminopimelate ligase
MTSPARAWTLARLGSALARFAPALVGDDVAVTGLSQDSRRIRPGDVFALRPGSRDPLSFLSDARERGAVAVLCARGTDATNITLPRLEVSEIRPALAQAAELVHDSPSRALGLVGITGTNGKTTTASLVAQCLRALSGPTAVLGTLGFDFDGVRQSFGLTTPEADQISSLLARARGLGAKHAVMEVSSHALATGRVSALAFAVAAFSNLTQDHLDFHGSLAEYGRSKARLFHECAPRMSVLNIDDAFGAELAAGLPEALLVGRAPSASVRLLGEREGERSRVLDVRVGPHELSLPTRLFGAHNADNWLLCLGILYALGCDLSRLPEVSLDVRGAPGRFERCDVEGDDIVVIVDYAHTEDALQRTLVAARALTAGKLWCVFGCGGDRDVNKRGPMGAAAGRHADHCIITNDNPRSEDPRAIARAIELGLVAAVGSNKHELCLDRAEAIARAVAGARPGDLVLIAGKGHEDYQLLGSERIHFDDREQARAALAARRRH